MARSHPWFSILATEPGPGFLSVPRTLHTWSLTSAWRNRGRSYANLQLIPGLLQVGTRQWVYGVHVTKPARPVAGASGYCHQLPGYPELFVEPCARILFPVWGVCSTQRGLTDDGVPEDVRGGTRGHGARSEDSESLGVGRTQMTRAWGPKRDGGAERMPPGTNQGA